MCRILCSYVFQSNKTENKSMHIFWICLELTSPAQYKQKHYLNNVFPKMIAMVFLLIGANLLFICFSFQKKGNKNIKGKILCLCFDIVWTHNPGTVTKTPFKQWFCQNYRNDVFAQCAFISFSFHNNGTEMGSKIVYAHFFWICWAHKTGTVSKTTIYFFWGQNDSNRIFCLLYRICCLYVFDSKTMEQKYRLK